MSDNQPEKDPDDVQTPLMGNNPTSHDELEEHNRGFVPVGLNTQVTSDFDSNALAAGHITAQSLLLSLNQMHKNQQGVELLSGLYTKQASTINVMATSLGSVLDTVKSLETTILGFRNTQSGTGPSVSPVVMPGRAHQDNTSTVAMPDMAQQHISGAAMPIKKARRGDGTSSCIITSPPSAPADDEDGDYDPDDNISRDGSDGFDEESFQPSGWDANNDQEKVAVPKGERVRKRLAESTKSYFVERRPEQILEELKLNFQTPENCQFLNAKRVNKEIFSGKIPANLRGEDAAVQAVQSLHTQASTAVMRSLENLWQLADSVPAVSKAVSDLQNCLKIMGTANIDLNQFRRNRFKHHLKRKQLTDLVPEDHTELFGDLKILCADLDAQASTSLDLFDEPAKKKGKKAGKRDFPNPRQQGLGRGNPQGNYQNQVFSQPPFSQPMGLQQAAQPPMMMQQPMSMLPHTQQQVVHMPQHQLPQQQYHPPHFNQQYNQPAIYQNRGGRGRGNNRGGRGRANNRGNKFKKQ